MPVQNLCPTASGVIRNRPSTGWWLKATAVVAFLVGLSAVLVVEGRRRAVLLELEQAGIKSTFGGGSGLGPGGDVLLKSRLPGWAQGRVPFELGRTWFFEVERMSLDVRSGQVGFTDIQVRGLRRLTDTRCLCVRGTLGPDDFSVIKDLSRLNLLQVWDDSGRTEGGELVRNQPELRRIELLGVKLSGDSLGGLQTCPNLKTLQLVGRLDKGALAHIGRCSQLKQLLLTHADVSLAFSLKLVELRELSASDLAMLSGLKQLSGLQLTKVERHALQGLPSMPNLALLHIDGDVTLAEVKQLSRFPALERVNVQSLAFFEECLGAHTAVPSQLEGRITPLENRLRQITFWVNSERGRFKVVVDERDAY